MKLPRFLRGKASAPRAPQAYWKAGSTTNRAFRDRGASGPNLANLGYLNTARKNARNAARNSALAARAIALDVTNIIGTGIVPRFAERLLQDAWLRWEDECDADGVRDIYALQEAAVRSWREGGEAFIRIRPRRPSDGLFVPMQVQLYEAEMLPLLDRTLPNGNKIIQGVELNLIGQRVAYWFHKNHPLDNYGGASISLGSLSRVPADLVCHLFEPLRPGQVRGFPPLATALQRIQQMDDFDEATIERQKAASSITLVLTRPEPSSAGVDPITGEAIGDREVSDISAGSAYTLLPGEDVKGLDLPSLGGEYEAFHKVQGRGIAAALDQPYELLTGDFGGLSDRTARVIINEYRRRVEQHQWNRVIRQVMRKIAIHFVEMAKLADVVPGDASDNVKWVPPAWPYFYPTQDVAAIKAEIEAGLRSRQDAIYSRGNDPDTVLEERGEDLRREREANLTSTTVNKPEEAGNG